MSDSNGTPRISSPAMHGKGLTVCDCQMYGIANSDMRNCNWQTVSSHWTLRPRTAGAGAVLKSIRPCAGGAAANSINNAIAKAVRAARGNYRFRRQPRAELSAHDRNRLKLKPANKM